VPIDSPASGDPNGQLVRCLPDPVAASPVGDAPFAETTGTTGRMLRSAWRRYRQLRPRWQVTIAVVAALLVIGAVNPDEETTDQSVSIRSAPIEESLPFASTTTVERTSTTAEHVLTTTTAAPTTTMVPTTTTTAIPVTTTTAAPPPPPTTAAPLQQAPSDCHPSYDPCLAPMSDYDCAGGSGNGPGYTGTVRVTGYDEYDLDRDGDGIGCE
jgi:hypothetical protein